MTVFLLSTLGLKETTERCLRYIATDAVDCRLLLQTVVANARRRYMQKRLVLDLHSLLIVHSPARR